jgi:hypothetical protein
MMTEYYLCNNFHEILTAAMKKVKNHHIVISVFCCLVVEYLYLIIIYVEFNVGSELAIGDVKICPIGKKKVQIIIILKFSVISHASQNIKL